MKKSQFIIKNIKNNKKSYILPFIITATISFIVSLILIISVSSLRYNLKYEKIYFGDYDAEISKLDENQIENVKNHISVGKTGEVLDTEETTDIFSELGYLKNYDKNSSNMLGLELAAGKYPIEENEIAIEKKSENLIRNYSVSEDSSKDTKSAYPYSIKIPVIDKNGNKKDKILVVTGAINEKYDNENWEKNIYVSKSYADNVGYKKSEIIKFKDVGRCNVIKIQNSLKKLASDVGFDQSGIKLVSRIDYIKFIFLDNFCVTVALSLAILLVSYIILKNINRARLHRNIKDMAILEAIGASSAQIKNIVNIQAFILSIFSVSVGLGINLLFILILKIMYLNKTNLSNTSGLFSLMQATSENIRFLDIFFIFVIIELLVFLSYILSSRKTVKTMLNMDIPSSINNPYAVYSEVKRENRKSNNKVNIKRRYKYKNTGKASIVVIFVILAFTASIVKSIDSGSESLYKNDVDYIVRNIDMYSENKSNLPLEKIFSNVAITEDMEENISKILGVTAIEKNYTTLVKYYENNSSAYVYGLYGIDDEELDNLIKSARYDNFDVEKFKRGNTICVHSMYAKEMGIDIGDKIELEVLENGIQKKKTFEVINISQITPDFAFIYQSAFDKGLAKNINSINIKCSEDKKKSVKIAIERMLESKSGNVEFVDCGEELDKNEAYISAINIIFSVVAGFAIILTIFNSINGSIYEIMSQSADFGVLMAIGISDKQLEEVISKKIEDRVAIPAILGVVLGSIFVFLMSKVLIEVSTIKLNISTPWILYLFIIITAILSVKIGTKYVCNKMKKLSPTDIINNV
ncbi:FtsX-like permease family protein [Peptacetobacter hiranonis]|uniref:ABC transporter permease n=1 Tax=Peptacetobacter hiranonis TaxID=89152 RepID=UPI0019171A48|nr:FtsX-like permease family protein [Peptacetobacter hiranonis]QQQ87543.1 FtsX-like permease family protein [Peptacetobacter hiranonis]